MITGWKEMEGATYYFQEDGKMSVGWEKIGEDTYYFDKEGKMLTGSQRIFQLDCVFGEDGKLQSKTSKVNPEKPMKMCIRDSRKTGTSSDRYSERCDCKSE